ncbi:hypothetical protein [Streptomyces sp. NPDC007088]|uniref:hypothetical protein n=1 Tax=Streptomyces sp. NPDC007088 TaxID=3364773 RepID=UPI0036A6F16E
MSASPAPPAPSGPAALVRATAAGIRFRLRKAGELPPAALTSAIGLVDDDEAETALDHLVHALAFFRVPVSRQEYADLASAAVHWDAEDVLTEAGLERLAEERQAEERQAEERQAEERQAEERQAEERQAMERQAEERQAMERQAEERQAMERQAEDDGN